MTFGNLLNRTVSMINKYLMANPSIRRGVTEFDYALAQVAAESIADYHTHMEAKLITHCALEAVWTLIAPINTSTRPHTPWGPRLDDFSDQLASVMSHLAASLRVVAHLT